MKTHHMTCTRLLVWFHQDLLLQSASSALAFTRRQTQSLCVIMFVKRIYSAFFQCLNPLITNTSCFTYWIFLLWVFELSPWRWWWWCGFSYFLDLFTPVKLLPVLHLCLSFSEAANLFCLHDNQLKTQGFPAQLNFSVYSNMRIPFIIYSVKDTLSKPTELTFSPRSWSFYSSSINITVFSHRLFWENSNYFDHERVNGLSVSNGRTFISLPFDNGVLLWNVDVN